MFDEDGFCKHNKVIVGKQIKKNERIFLESELVIVEEENKKEVPNLKVQNTNEIFQLKNISLHNKYSMTNIERLLKVREILKKDEVGEYTYFERIYTYCFDLVKDGELVNYYEMQGKTLPEVRERVRKMILKKKI